MLQEFILETVGFGLRDLHVGGDATAPVDGASTVGELDFLADVRVGLIVVVVVVVVKRYPVVFALDQTSAGRVVLGGGQGQARVLAERVDSLYQTFAEGALANYESAIMVLDGSAYDLGG